MTRCNQCDGVMLPDGAALIPALVCSACGRVIPRGFSRSSREKGDRRQLNRALRAARRAKLGKG